MAASLNGLFSSPVPAGTALAGERVTTGAWEERKLGSSVQRPDGRPDRFRAQPLVFCDDLGDKQDNDAGYFQAQEADNRRRERAVDDAYSDSVEKYQTRICRVISQRMPATMPPTSA